MMANNYCPKLCIIKSQNCEQNESDKKASVMMDKLPSANIIVTGKWGCGKSTLINAALQKINTPINFFETSGLDIYFGYNGTQLIGEFKKLVEGEDNFQCIWYCIFAPSMRLTFEEIEFITYLYKICIPVVIVMTQCFSKKQNDMFQKGIEEELKETVGEDIPVIQLLALEKEIEFDDEVKVIPARGLEELINCSMNYISKT